MQKIHQNLESVAVVVYEMLTLRNRFRSLLGALFCLFFISFGVPVSQAMTDDEQITQWINENYVSLLRLSQAEVLSSYDSAVFPDFTVETPRIVANFAEDAASGSGYSLDINGEYVAVISNPDGLPILLLNFVKQGSEITDGKILEDPKLAERIFSFTEGTVIVHDLPTKAWYRIIADKIEAIDTGGEKVLL
ncbi:MAG: hypothetical protein SPG61_02015, partial [Arcanobacterium sp.]|nr:hypothetical protein [Arcanobacterium sp.]